jgi:hypothetical protein
LDEWSELMTTRKIKGFNGYTLAIAVISAICFSPIASAAPCSAEIVALKAAVESGICQYKKKKCKGLNRKLDKTERKLEKGNFRHAARKLSDFGSVIESMAMRRKPKISMDDYEALMDPHYVAVADCIANGGITTRATPEDVVVPTREDEDAAPIKVIF